MRYLLLGLVLVLLSIQHALAFEGENIYQTVTSQQLKGYPSYQEVYEFFRNLEEKYPNVRVEVIGHTVGGKPIIAAIIGDSWLYFPFDRPRFLWVARYHGDEAIGTVILMKFAEKLAKGEIDPKGVHIIVPWLNADRDRHRKNLNGVDLNRNHPFQWGGPGSSGDPSSPIYRGPYPLSEPETRAMVELLDKYKPVFAVTFHSGTEVIAYPWGYTYRRPKDFEEYERLLAWVNDNITKRGFKPYKIGQTSHIIYIASGVFSDYAYSKGVKTLVIEVSYQKTPPYSQVDYYFLRQLPLELVIIDTYGKEVPILGPAILVSVVALVCGGILSIKQRSASPR